MKTLCFLIEKAQYTALNIDIMRPKYLTFGQMYAIMTDGSSVLRFSLCSPF